MAKKSGEVPSAPQSPGLEIPPPAYSGGVYPVNYPGAYGPQVGMPQGDYPQAGHAPMVGQPAYTAMTAQPTVTYVGVGAPIDAGPNHLSPSYGFTLSMRLLPLIFTKFIVHTKTSTGILNGEGTFRTLNGYHMPLQRE